MIFNEEDDDDVLLPGGGNNSLAPGTVLLNNYEIVSILGNGGFGIVYLAKELAKRDGVVAIKEYFPRAICGRAFATKKISPENVNDKASYKKGAAAFVNEASTLLKLMHPRIIRVHHVFQELGNVYYAMAYCEGESLQSKINAGYTPTAEQARAWLIGVLEGLAYVHQNGLLHLDLSPANILIDKASNPLLIDFGAARDAVGQASQLLSVIARQGYTPFEQYDQYQLVPHTPATDLYALGATFYHLLSGALPISCLSRKIDGTKNRLRPLSTVDKAQHFAGLIPSIEKAMEVNPADRWQSADEWLAELRSPEAPRPVPPAVNTDPDHPPDTGRVGRISMAIAGAIFAFFLFILMIAERKDDTPVPVVEPPTESGPAPVPPVAPGPVIEATAPAAPAADAAVPAVEAPAADTGAASDAAAAAAMAAEAASLQPVELVPETAVETPAPPGE